MSFDYEDRLFGTVTLAEPVLVDLIHSPAVQRLQGVLQHGITGLIGVTRPTTRFEHSMGVMLLVRRMGAPLEEQVAALLHDVSHTAFSHVIDYVVRSQAQNYHDVVKADYVAGTSLPGLLAAHDLDWQQVIQEDRYPLLEQPAPALCADRLDYFLRDALDLGLATPAECQWALDHLVVRDGRIMVDDLTVAGWIAETYLRVDDGSWSDFREVGLYELAAQAIRRGLELGVITEADFWGTDAAVWAILQHAEDARLQELLALVSPETRFVWDADQPDFMLKTKIRTLDPDVAINGQACPLSALDAAYAARRETYLAHKSGRWPFRVVRPV